jgi:hypothetical protein
MSTKAYSIHIDDDVAPFVEAHKKRAGKMDTRGKYVSRAIRAYEDLLNDENEMAARLEAAEQYSNDMRTVARDFAGRMHKYIDLFTWALQPEGERGDQPTFQSYEIWSKADKAIRAALAEVELRD